MTTGAREVLSTAGGFFVGRGVLLAVAVGIVLGVSACARNEWLVSGITRVLIAPREAAYARAVERLGGAADVRGVGVRPRGRSE